MKKASKANSYHQFMNTSLNVFYLISIPRPATSVATKMSFSPFLRQFNENSLKRQNNAISGSSLLKRVHDEDDDDDDNDYHYV